MEIAARYILIIILHNNNIANIFNEQAIALVTPLNIEKRENSITIGVMPGNRKKELCDFQNF